MNKPLVHAPQQSRSQDTQEKVLQALEELLGERFFEQITIRDLAARAGVSSGTIYRRFKDKEALLPVLYERFNHLQTEWGENFWEDVDLESEQGLAPRIRHLVSKHVDFYQAHAPILRTIYLYMRLNGELSLEDIDQQRQSLYIDMMGPVLAATADDEQIQLSENQYKLFLLLLLSSVNERVLFGDVKPVRTLPMSDEHFVSELSSALHAYLLVKGS
jgi:AcrR family transcriptional regulator